MLSCKNIFRNKLNKGGFSLTKYRTSRQNSRNQDSDRINSNIFNTTKNDQNEKNFYSKTNTPFSTTKQHISFPTKTTNNSSSEYSLNLYKIRNPNTVNYPIKEKIKKIKKLRQIFLENYYTESLKSSSIYKNSNLFSKDGTFISPFYIENSDTFYNTTDHFISKTENLIPNQRKKCVINTYDYKKIYSQEGTVSRFLDEVKNMTKVKYKQQCLKKKTMNYMMKKNTIEDKIKIGLKSKTDNHKLFDQFYSAYEKYHRLLLKESNKDVNYSKLLNWYLISLKNDIQSLHHKKEKLTNKINKYIEVKNFIKKMREYCEKKEIKGSVFERFQTTRIDPKQNTKENEKNTKMLPINQLISKSPDDIQKFRRFSTDENAVKHILKTNTKKLRNRRFSQLITKNEIKEKDDICPRSNKITTVINRHITDLLMYQNQLNNDIKPLQDEYDFNVKAQKTKEGIKITEEMEVLFNKLRKQKEKNLILVADLENIKKSFKNNKNLNKFYIKIEQKLFNIHNVLIENKINHEIEYRKQRDISIINNILYYLKNIEIGINILKKEKANLKKNCPKLHDMLVMKINEANKEKIKKLTIQKQIIKEKRKITDIIHKMQKTVYKRTKVDYSRFVKRSKTKEKKIISDGELNLYQEYKYFIGYHK